MDAPLCVPRSAACRPASGSSCAISCMPGGKRPTGEFLSATHARAFPPAGWPRRPHLRAVCVLFERGAVLAQHDAPPKAAVQAGSVHHNRILNVVPAGKGVHRGQLSAAGVLLTRRRCAITRISKAILGSRLHPLPATKRCTSQLAVSGTHSVAHKLSCCAPPRAQQPEHKQNATAPESRDRQNTCRYSSTPHHSPGVRHDGHGGVLPCAQSVKAHQLDGLGGEQRALRVAQQVEQRVHAVQLVEGHVAHRLLAHGAL